MPKHFFQVRLPDQHLSVNCGWDRACQHFYLNVERFGATEDDAPIYLSVLDERLSRRSGSLLGALTLHELSQRLSELCITPPAGLLDALSEDQHINHGNAIQTWPAS